ncbi:MAG: metal-dependent transcriptional regulator [Gemmatimonadota bacterium]
MVARESLLTAAARTRGPGGTAEGGPSRAVEDYLKAVYKLQQGAPSVSTTALAEELGRSAASVTNMVKSLAEQGLLEHTPYRGVHLTAAGEHTALRIIRRHRVLELYLIEKLGYTWDNVHGEAERLEHAVSDALIDRMARALGEPAVDPHGSPIPTREGVIAEMTHAPLSLLECGACGVVGEVSDESAEGLRRLAALGLFPGTRLEVVGRLGSSGGVAIDVEGRRVEVERGLADTIFVEVDAE